MGAYRYWRVNLNRENPNGRVALRALELRGVVGGPTLTVPGGGITAESAGALPVLNLIDGNSTTQYETLGGVPSVTYDFGSPTVIAEVAFQLNEYGGYMAPAPGSYLSASNDLKTWVYFSPSFGWSSGATANTWVTAAPTVESDPAATRVSPGAPMLLPTVWPSGGAGRGLPGISRFGIDTGPFRVDGSVFIDGTPDVPVSRRVRLLDRLSARLVREVWSDPVTGAYAFENLPAAPDGYVVLAHDHTGVFGAEAKDRITAIL